MVPDNEAMSLTKSERNHFIGATSFDILRE